MPCSLKGLEQGALKLEGPEQTERGSRLGGSLARAYQRRSRAGDAKG